MIALCSIHNTFIIKRSSQACITPCSQKNCSPIVVHKHTERSKPIDWPDSAVPLLLQSLVKNYSHPWNPLINHSAMVLKGAHMPAQNALSVKRLQNANMANYATLCCSVKDGGLTMTLKHILMALKFTVLFSWASVDTCAFWQNSQKSPSSNWGGGGGGGGGRSSSMWPLGLHSIQTVM